VKIKITKHNNLELVRSLNNAFNSILVRGADYNYNMHNDKSKRLEV